MWASGNSIAVKRALLCHRCSTYSLIYPFIYHTHSTLSSSSFLYPTCDFSYHCKGRFTSIWTGNLSCVFIRPASKHKTAHRISQGGHNKGTVTFTVIYIYIRSYIYERTCIYKYVCVVLKAKYAGVEFTRRPRQVSFEHANSFGWRQPIEVQKSRAMYKARTIVCLFYLSDPLLLCASFLFFALTFCWSLSVDLILPIPSHL